MKMFCISDTLEKALGLKLSGVESSILTDKEKLDKKIDDVLADADIGILVITDDIYKMSMEKFDYIKSNRRIPLIVKI